jgi:hypothetical protein
MSNYIGNIAVDGWQGTPEGIEMELEIVSRGGLNGVDVYTLGSRGTQFQISSFEYVADYHAALNRVDDYRRLITFGPVPLHVNGRTNSRYMYQVLHVQPDSQRTRAITAASKGSGYRGLCVCTWTLLPISIT